MGGFLTTATSLPSSDHPRPHLLEVVCARNTQEQRLTATWGAHNGNQLACTGCTVCPQHFTTIAWRLMPRPQTRQQATLATPFRQQQTVIGPTTPHQRSTVAGGGLSRTPSVAWFRVVHVASRCTDAPRDPLQPLRPFLWSALFGTGRVLVRCSSKHGPVTQCSYFKYSPQTA